MPIQTSEPTAPNLRDVRAGSRGAIPADVTAPTRGVSRGYVTAWAVLGALSAGYLVVAAWEGSGHAVAARSEMNTRVAQLSTDVSELKVKVTGLAEAQTSDQARLASLESTVETRLGGLASSAAKVATASEPAAAPVVAPAPAAVAANAPKTVSVPGVMLVTTKPAPPAPPAPKPQADASAVAPPAEPAAQPRQPTKIIAAAPTTDPAHPVAAAVQPAAKAVAKQKAVVAKAPDAYKPAAAIETGSLPARATTGPIGLEVASAGSLDAARQSWGGIASRAGDALSGAEPRLMPSVDGTSFRVIAGPYASEADAQKACAALKARGVACRSTGFGGAPL